MRDGCPFCEYEGPSDVLATFRERLGGVFVIEPIDPVVRGHLLVVSGEHVKDFADMPEVTGHVMEAAAWYAKTHGGQWNLITSLGPLATQTVGHLHVHLVPRRDQDGLRLPWTTLEPERVAQAFHEAYERLAPDFGYKTREASAVPWEDVPDANRQLMVAVADELLSERVL